MTAVCAASVLFAPAWVAVIAAAYVAAQTYAKIKLAKYTAGELLKKHDNLDTIAPNFGTISKELYNKSGLSPEKFPIYDAKLNTETALELDETVKVSRFRLFLISLVKNERTLQTAPSMIVIPKSYLELLDDAEKKSVLAIQFAEIKSANEKPNPAGFVSSLITRTSNAVNSLCMIAGFFSTSFASILTTMGTTFASDIALKAFGTSESIETLQKETKDLTLLELFTRKKTEILDKVALETVMVATMSAFNLAYLGIHVVARTLQAAAKAAHSAVSRELSLQADRDSVEQLGTDPLALITALRKIDAVKDNSIKNVYRGAPIPDKGYLRKAWDKACNPFPSTERRIAQMVTIAQKNGVAQSDIEQAVSGAITVGPEHNLPREAVTHMMATAASTKMPISRLSRLIMPYQFYK
jgi:hypothetical protein